MVEGRHVRRTAGPTDQRPGAAPPLRLRTAGAAVLAGLLACSQAEPVETRQIVGDTTVVDNVAPVIEDTLKAQEVARIGRADGPPDFLFSEIFAFAVGPDGSVFVHDRENGIRRFSPDGAEVAWIARQGPGPGETRYVLGMSVDREGRLAAVDLGNARVSVFGADGELEASFRRPEVRPRYGDGSITFLADGSLWMGMFPLRHQQAVMTHPLPAFLRLAADGDVRDTLWTPADAAAACPTLSEPAYSVGFWEDTRTPFVPKATWSLGRDGTLAVGCPSTYSLDVRTPDGKVVRIKRPWTPKVLSDDVREQLRGQARLAVVPKELPVYSRIILPGDGRVWVWPNQPFQRVRLDAEAAERFGVDYRWSFPWEGAFDVFLDDGTWLATVRLPKGARFNGFPMEPDVEIRGDTLWAVARDSLGVETIVRYRILGLGDPRSP